MQRPVEDIRRELEDWIWGIYRQRHKLAPALNSSFSDKFFVFVFKCYTFGVTCFPVSARVSARVLARVSTTKEKDTERDTRHLSTHLCVPTSSRHPLSDLATQPIRWPDRTPLARLGPLAPCATEPLTGDLDCVSSVDFLFFLVFCAATLAVFCFFCFLFLVLLLW